MDGHLGASAHFLPNSSVWYGESPYHTLENGVGWGNRLDTNVVDLRYSEEDEAFRKEAREWLTEQLEGDFAAVRWRGGPGDEHVLFEERLEWERALAAGQWTCLSWPEEYGGRAVTLLQQVIFYEEYARAGGPGRVGLVGEGLIGPTILHFGTDAQKERFLPKIVSGEELWCQGYSEPNAGSDLANLATRAELDGEEWVLHGQKVWTSLAHWADWCFVLARTNRDAPRHRGISYLLVRMRQPGIEVRPIVQVTGTSEFNEVFFDGARTARDLVVGDVDGGWKVAMGTLAFERGALTLGQQLGFQHEWDQALVDARGCDQLGDPVLRQRFADTWLRLQIMRYSALRALSAFEQAALTPVSAINKLYWATLHQEITALAIDVLGPDAERAEDAPTYELTRAQAAFLFARSDSIYGGSHEIQRNIIGERVLGLPAEPKVV